MTSKELISRLDNVFQGSPWYGNALLKTVSQIEMPNTRQGEGKSIGQILEHIVQWRCFAIEKLQQNKDFDIEINSKQDWNKGKEYTMSEFFILVEQLKNSQEEMKNLLTDKSEEWLNGTVPGREYSFAYLIEGIIQHDIYHLGQIGLLGSSLSR